MGGGTRVLGSQSSKPRFVIGQPGSPGGTCTRASALETVQTKLSRINHQSPPKTQLLQHLHYPASGAWILLSSQRTEKSSGISRRQSTDWSEKHLGFSLSKGQSWAQGVVRRGPWARPQGKEGAAVPVTLTCAWPGKQEAEQEGPEAPAPGLHPEGLSPRGCPATRPS